MDRQEVLDAITRQVRDGGGTLVRSVKDLAADIGIGPQRLYYLLKTFEQKGQLVTHSRGPKGLEIHLGNGDDTVAKRPRLPRRSRRSAAADLPVTGDRYYCPWCGQTVQTGWRFCISCGERLPGAAAAPNAQG